MKVSLNSKLQTTVTVTVYQTYFYQISRKVSRQKSGKKIIHPISHVAIVTMVDS